VQLSGDAEPVCSYLATLSQYERAIEAGLDGYVRFLDLDDQQGAAHCLCEAGRYKITINQNKDGHRCLEQALALYQASDDRVGETMCLSGLAWSEWNLGRFESALEHLGRALELSEQHGDRLGVARTCYSLSVAWVYYYDVERVQAFAERSVRLYREMGLAQAAYRPMFMLWESYYSRGDLAQAQALGEQVCAAARVGRDSWLEGWAAHMLGRLALSRGDLRTAHRYLRRAYLLRRETGERQNQVNDLVWLGRLQLARGRPAVALRYTCQGIKQLESLWEEVYLWEMPDILLGHAEALAANGDLCESRAYVQRAHATLMLFAAQIRDPAVRRVFFEHPTNAHLVAVWESGWPLKGRQIGH
jgi:tetratricopeptide (TPR) repeat protein